ncbi:MAG: AIR synthase-related protein, partial [Actinomycetota bacterium]|nr:AIR synthase-related protein [Actinomycetota bacterium]
LHVDAVPILSGVPELAADGLVPGGSRRNLAWARERLESGDVDEATMTLLADAQTSGGLLFGARHEAATAAVQQLRASGHDAAVIGRATSGSGTIRLRHA